jgi:chromosome segregation ATPase
MERYKMKSSLTPQNLLQAAILIMACATTIDAIAATDNDAKDKQAVHRMQLQLHAAQQEKTELADQVEVLKKQVSELEAKRAALEKKLNGQSRQISELSDKQLSDKQQQAELSDKYQETEKKLKLMEQQYATTSNNLQQTQMEKEQEKKKLDGDIQVCEKKNSELYLLSVKLMDKYQAKGVLDAIRQAEPFTQLEKVRIENLLQEYRDKSDANRIASGRSNAQDAQHP